MAPPNPVFLYAEWRYPNVLYSLLHGNPNPPRPITDRYRFKQATLYADPRQPASSVRRGASVDGVYVTGLTEADIQRIDQYFGGNCERQEVIVRMICCHGRELSRKATIWLRPSLAAETPQSWTPHGLVNGTANGAANAV